MKKLIALLLALVMVFALVACAAKEASADKPAADTPAADAPAADAPAVPKVEEGSNKSASGQTDKDVYIDFWGVWSNDHRRAVYWQEKANEFCEAYEAETGISVAFEYYGQGSYGELSEKLAAGAASKTLPVISQIEEQATARFYPLAADLSKYLKPETIEDYMDGLLVSCTQQGKLVAVPAGRSYIVANVNKTLLEQAGHTVEELEDWTWEDMYQIAKDISALGDDVWGHAQYWDEDAWPWESALYSNGGSIDNAEGTEIVFTVEQGTPILDLNVKMMNEGISYSAYTDFAPGDVADAFYVPWAEGKLGMFLGSITQYKSAMGFKENYGEGAAEFETVIAKQPAGSAGFSVVTGGSNMMILDSATETQKKVAAAYFEYLCKPDYVAEWNEVSGYLAFTDSVVESEAFKATTTEDPNLYNIYKFVEDAHARPSTPYWQDMYSNVLMPDLVDMCQHPDQYGPDATAAMVAEWKDACQQILDENN